MSSVTFETKCYEKDWEILLKTGRLEQMIKRNCFDFAERILYINNVADPDQVRFYAGKLKERDVITQYVFVDEYAREALDFFGLDRDSFRGGYYYSIQELVGIYRCQTEYLLHFAGDSMLEKPFHWIEQSIAKLEEDPRVKVVNCLPDGSACEAEAQAYEEDDNFWLGYGFSDQCYLIRTADYRQRIFNETHPASERYPQYGGELFERKVDSWMHNHDFLRATYKNGNYLHRNYPSNRLVRTIARMAGRYDR
ncbi:MAG: hypothetical protein M0023_01055 [Desulfobacteraceae bacterium]|nr:hypothetical protein [Desulfobacteraceae bacterium]